LSGQYIPTIGQGKARWNNVHVSDLAQLFVLLTEAAINKNTDAELWNEKGYYLVENGEHLWADLARLMGKKATDLGLVDGKLDEKSWGFNSRGKAERARKVVGWQPNAPSIEDTVEQILKDEKNNLNKN
jgi:nucleoside-diphosphate-sugar epimerase